MKVEGKSIFTVKSVNAGKPVMRPEAEEDLKKILELMKKNGFTRVES